MDDPVKIIFRYKNNNRRHQHNMYIFIGSPPQPVMTILNKIKDKSLIDSLNTLNINEVQQLEKFYGIHWYKKFFNTHHINFSMVNISTTPVKSQIENRLGKDWYNLHVEKYQIVEKKLFYSYAALVKNDLLQKESKKKSLLKDLDKDLDYTSSVKKIDVSKMLESVSIQDAGKNQLSDTPFLDSYSLESILESSLDADSDEDLSLSFDDNDNDNDSVDGIDNDIDITDFADSDDVLELEKIYQDRDVEQDKNIDNTTNLIKEALKDDKLFKKVRSGYVEFDTSKDGLMYNEDLKNLFIKNYITSQYIFKDDTIKMIKDKICCSIKNNPKFGKDAFIAPSRQYLFSEYVYDDKLEKVMLGQKWVRRTDLLKVDVEPNNNIRYYEELRGNLKLLRDNIKRYGSKIKFEDDDYGILYDYNGYYMNNELYMLDVYNELGLGYNPDAESVKNVSEVYFRLYFPRIKQDDIKHIIDYLNKDKTVEQNKIKIIEETISNDLILENQIMQDIEMVKRHPKYKELFKSNFITQSVIHINLRLETGSKIDLLRIFDEFKVSEKYPFVQYQSPDGQIFFKYSNKHITEFSSNKDNIDVLTKWFENAPYGISFKVKIVEDGVDKYTAINLKDTGRIEYKAQWKEEEQRTVTDIKMTYQYVKELIEQLNKDKNRVTFYIPHEEEYKYAFINSIQRFILPEGFSIDHNDLSEFSRYFYPYVTLVVEPRKRQSKVKKDVESSKFGTYLRYRRVSKYENRARIEQRILYFMKNYEYTVTTLANEISKQFNITLEKASEEIEKVKERHTNIKRSRKILKKLENIPKYKPPGIGIDIQGKQKDRYKIRISGARNQEQLDRITTFMNILIFLYSETYLQKKPERQILKEKLKKLTNIAKRRNLVDRVVNHDKEIKTVKQMTAVDKKRIGFKPEKDQNQWTRSCQNSGTDKKRRPQQMVNEADVLAAGFKLNSKTGVYEKTVKYKTPKGKLVTTMIRAVGLGDSDNSSVYYSCNPKDNGEHMYIGFLSRSKNPFGQPMPCCFKKDAFASKNKSKREFFLDAIGKIEKVEKKEGPRVVGDQLYILQDTNKIQEGRLGNLPKYLNMFMNISTNKSRKIKHHYLVKTETGFYFKYGAKQDSYPFFNAISAVLDISVPEIKKRLVNLLQEDTTDTLFTAVNNGDVRTRFKTRQKFIKYITTSNNLPYNIFGHFITIPGVLNKDGLNLIIFNKHTTSVQQSLEKEKIREDFSVQCTNSEEIMNVEDPSYTSIFLIKENKNYYPIVLVSKADENTKKVDIIKTFKYENSKDNIVHHIKDFYIQNCKSNVIKEVRSKKENLTAKMLYDALHKLKLADLKPRYQIVDARNKCKYIVTTNSTIIPTKPSGSIYNLQILKNLDNKVVSVSETVEKLQDLYTRSKGTIPVKPIGIYFSSRTKTDALVVAVTTETYDSVPTKQETVTMEYINKHGLVADNKQLYDKIDEEIVRGVEHKKQDVRVRSVLEDEYDNENYELFRFELSEYLNSPENEKVKKKIQNTVNSTKLNREEKKRTIRRILYRLVDKRLAETYDTINNTQKGGKIHKFVHVVSNKPDVKNYNLDNTRNKCDVNHNKDTCNSNMHCRWSHDKCYLSLTLDMATMFVNRVSEELLQNDLKAYELLKLGDYFVSDIVDPTRFTERKGQKIIKSTTTGVDKVLGTFFGKENIPQIGRKKLYKVQVNEVEDLNVQNPMRNMGDYSVQLIIPNNISVFRAFANCYMWLENKLLEKSVRNIGYFSTQQTDMANYFRSNIVDWLSDKNNQQIIDKELKPYLTVNVTEFINNISKDVSNSTSGVVELYILAKLYKKTVVIYNQENMITYIIDKDKDKIQKINSAHTESIDLQNSFHIRFSYLTDNNIPNQVETLYF